MHLTGIRVRTGGFTYLGVLFLISVLAITAAAASVVWSIAGQRDAERELVFVGQQFQTAIEHYRATATDPALTYPRQLEDLLRDDRSITPQRHLRRLYADPMTGDSQWGLIKLPDGGIVGIHSLSDRKRYPRDFVAAGFSAPMSISYREWRFVAPSAVEMLAVTEAANPLISAPLPVLLQSPVAPVRQQRADGVDWPPAGEPESAVQPVIDRAVRPTQQDIRSRTPEACSRVAAHDEQSCQQVAGSAGEDAARACRDSAVQRSVACALGTSGGLPPLVRVAP